MPFTVILEAVQFDLSIFHLLFRRLLFVLVQVWINKLLFGLQFHILILVFLGFSLMLWRQRLILLNIIAQVDDQCFFGATRGKLLLLFCALNVNPLHLVFVWAVVESTLLALGEAASIAILLLAAIHAIPNVNLINFLLRHVFEVVCALRMQPALVRAEFLANFAGHHEFLLDLSSANAI